MKRIKIGDIIQILSSEGVSYAQYTHKHKSYGALISVFEGFYPVKPKDFKPIVNNIPQFQAFICLQRAINQGFFTVVANEDVAPCNKEFPIFKQRSGGGGNTWWLWDGEEENMLNRDLTEAEKKYPYRSIISAPLLIERIENGYRPEMDALEKSTGIRRIFSYFSKKINKQ